MEPWGRSGYEGKRPFFYGWYILGVGILIQLASVFSLSRAS